MWSVGEKSQRKIYHVELFFKKLLTEHCGWLLTKYLIKQVHIGVQCATSFARIIKKFACWLNISLFGLTFH